MQGKNSVKIVRSMANISAVDVSATKTTMEIGANFGMNVQLIKTVVYKESVQILMERRYQRNNVTAIQDGSVLVVIKVNMIFEFFAKIISNLMDA